MLYLNRRSCNDVAELDITADFCSSLSAEWSCAGEAPAYLLQGRASTEVNVDKSHNVSDSGPGQLATCVRHLLIPCGRHRKPRYFYTGESVYCVQSQCERR